MPAILSKNCILTGDVDSYCIVCSTHLPGHEDVLAHIQESKHSASLKSTTYFEKFKEDFIKKVRSVYYCEVCNKTFPTTTKVGIHVKEESHLERRRRQFKRVGTSIVLQNNILVTENAWNSFVEDTCVLCDAELADTDHLTHRSEQTHILNVFRSAVIVDENNNIYRKVDGGHQCLTCNKILSDGLIAEHLNSSEHKDNLIQHVPNHNNAVENGKKTEDENETKVDVINENSNNNDTSSNETDTNNDTSSNATDGNTAAKKQSTINDGKTLYTRPVLMKGKDKPASSKTISEEVETFAKQHHLSVNEFNNTMYCNVCSLQVPATLNCVKEHVAGKKHKDKSTQSTKQPTTKKRDPKKMTTVNMSEFVDTVVQVETLSGKNYIIINDKHCVMFGDFIGFAKFGPKVVCRFCHIDMWEENLREHLMSDVHKNKLDASLVVTSLENEFVRQITSDLYHCGHCGKVESEFDDMLDHLNTPEHKLRKADNDRIFEHYKFEESVNRRTQAAQFYNLLHFMSFMENMRRF